MPQEDTSYPLSDASPTEAAAERLGRDFHVHLGAVGFNAVAGGILFAGVPLIAASLTQSPQEIAIVSAATSLPTLLGVVAGLVVDRTDRRRLRLVMFGARAGLLLGLVAVALTGNLSIWALAGLVLLYALAGVFIASANTAMVPQVAPRSKLAAANSRIQGAMFVLEDIIGAPLASLLVLAGAVWLFGVPGLFMVLALLVLWSGLRGRSFGAPQQRTENEPGVGAVAKALREIREGLGFMAFHKVLRPVFAMSMAANFAFGAYMAVFVLWMVGPDSAVGVPAELFPLYFTALALGAVTATLTVSRMLRIIPDFPLLIAGFWCIPGLIVIQVLWPGPWMMAVTMVLMGFGMTVGNVIFMTMSQKMVPGHMLGRFSGASQTASSGLTPLGALLGGLIAEHFGIAVLYLLVAAVIAAALVYPTVAVRQADVAALELTE